MAVNRPPLADRVAIVTGGSVGIGFTAALALVRAGVRVALVSRDQERVQHAAAELAQSANEAKKDHILALALDVRSPEDMEAMASRTLARFGRIDMLITAAGILRVGRGVLRTLAQTPEEEWDEIIRTNLKGTFLANRAVLPAMLRQGYGQIVNLSSTSGRKGLAFDAAYCASKFGVIGLTEALAAEVEHYGIKAHVLLPGAIDTGMWEQNGPLAPPPDIIGPERVADCILQLLTLPEDTVLDAVVVEPLKRHVFPARAEGRA